MIILTIEPGEGARVAHLHGAFEATDDPIALVDQLVGEAGSEPLIIDLTELSPALGPGTNLLLAALAHARTHPATAVVHPDLETRRALRAAAEGTPIVPSNDLVLHNPYASANVPSEQRHDH